MNAYQWFSLAAIALTLATWLVYFGLVPAWNEARKIASLPRIQQIFVVLFTFGMIHSAVTKPDFRFDGGIKQGANASWATNDTIHIEWQRDLSTGVYVPETAAVYIDYRPNTETNAEWGLLAQTTVGAWSWEGTLADATNYDYNVWAYYIPPEPVHTNGVWVYKTMKDRPNQYIIPLRARVEVNGQAISTPLAKRRDVSPAKAYIQDGLIGLWHGIDNAGWGLHQSGECLEWKNLCQGGADYRWFDGAKAKFTDNAVEFNYNKNGYADYRCDRWFGSPNIITMEVCTDARFAGNFASYFAGIQSGGCGQQNNSVFSVGKPGGGYYTTYNNSSYNGKFRTLAVTVNSSIIRYINGAKVNQIDGVTGIGWNDQYPRLSLSSDLGNELQGGITGKVYCMRIYNRVLTAEEIRHNYEVDKACFNLP